MLFNKTVRGNTVKLRYFVSNVRRYGADQNAPSSSFELTFVNVHTESEAVVPSTGIERSVRVDKVILKDTKPAGMRPFDLQKESYVSEI